MAWPFVLLAAGKSSRMGHPKGLLEYSGGTWLEAQVGTLHTQGINQVILVLGEDAKAYDAVLTRLPSVEARLNPDPEGGPFSSLQIGLEGLAGPAWVSPLDVPITAELITLAMALKRGVEAVVPTFNDRGGHPVLLSSTIVQRMMAINASNDDARLDHQLRLANTLRLPVADPRVVLNFNTPEDWGTYLSTGPR